MPHQILSFFYNFKNLCVLHGHVFVMNVMKAICFCLVFALNESYFSFQWSALNVSGVHLSWNAVPASGVIYHRVIAQGNKVSASNMKVSSKTVGN